MAARVTRQLKARESGLQYAPPAVWRQLSTPLHHAGAALQGDPDAFQRVLVCCARGTASFDCVRRLGHEAGQPVVHRRFAGASELDVGTDYVDVPRGPVMLRVIAMARRGLALPLTRAFLPDYSHLVLLLCGEPARDLALVQRVVAACKELPQAPTLLLVAAEASWTQPLAAVAAQDGIQCEPVRADGGDARASWNAVVPHLARSRAAADPGSVVPLHEVLAA